MHTQPIIASIWSTILKQPQIGRDDNFFDLGGTSQLALIAIRDMERALGKTIPIILLFDSETLESFSQAVDALPSEDRVESDFDREMPLPLLHTQVGVWFLERLHAGSRAYNIQIALSIFEDVDEGAIARSLRLLVQRHEALRSRIIIDERNGEPHQIILPHDEVPLRTIRYDGEPDAEKAINEFLVNELATSFDLEHGPILQCGLFRLSENYSVLSIVMHHTVGDGWSHAVIHRDLAEFYAADRASRQPRLPTIRVSYQDYVRGNAAANANTRGRQLDYWLTALSGAPRVLDLPTDRSRPVVASLRGARVSWVFDATFTEHIRRFALQNDATMFMVLLSAFAALLSRYSEQEDLVIGVPLANRGNAMSHALVGMLTNTLPMRANLKNAPTFQALVARIRRAVIDAMEQQDVPFDLLLRKLKDATHDLSRQPLFQTAFVFNDADQLQVPHSTWRIMTGHQNTSQFDLALYLIKRQDSLHLQIEYATDLFERSTVERMAEHFRNLLADALREPSKKVSKLRMSDDIEETKVLVEWQPSASEPLPDSVHTLLSRQVARTPTSTAIECLGEVLTYNAFEEKANQLSRYLVECGVGPEVAVGVSIDRSLDWAIALLAILKAGGVYIPLDANLPARRMARIMVAARLKLILVNRHHAPAIQSALAASQSDDGGTLPDIHEVETYRTWISTLPHAPPDVRVGPDNLAYAFFTSTSVGKQKGAFVEHAGLVNQLLVKCSVLKLRSTDRVAQTAAAALDSSIWQLLAPLICGASVSIVDDSSASSVDTLLNSLQSANVTVFQPVPSLLRTLLQEAGGKLRTLSHLRIMTSNCGSLTPDLCRRWFELLPGVPVVNAYGMVECSGDFAHYTLTSYPAGRQSIPIGVPIQNSRVLVLDKDGDLVPVGIRGEIYVEGIVVAQGSLEQPGFAVDTSVPKPRMSGGRSYRTGDRGRWRTDGTLELTDRHDRQIRLRGFRFPLQEVEASLMEHPQVEEAFATLCQPAGIDASLVAYVVLEGRCEGLDEQLGEFIKARLPPHMIPDRFVQLDVMPTDGEGRIDPTRLPHHDLEEQTDGGAHFQSQMEVTIATVWAEVLKIASIGQDDNFFDLGGHSLPAVRIARRLRDVLQTKVGVADIFRFPTVRLLAKEVDRRREDISK